MKANKSLITIMKVLVPLAVLISGCAKGEDDPWLSLHSRDTRISQTWSLVSLSGTVVQTDSGKTTNIDYEFDGVNLYITTDGETESFIYQYDMDIKDNGEVFSQEFMNNISTGALVSESSKTSYWYWGNDDQNKTSVNLSLTGMLAPYLAYDIPRLAYNDMTLMVDYSDNSTDVDHINDSTTVVTASSTTVDLELKWEVNLAGI